MRYRVSIRWTTTAIESLRALPKKVRSGLIDKVDELLTCGDPREVHKPLVGPLAGYYSIKYSRYRAIYTVEEERVAGKGVSLHLQVTLIVTGKRKEYDKHDVYEVARKLAEMVFDGQVRAADVAAKTEPRRKKKR